MMMIIDAASLSLPLLPFYLFILINQASIVIFSKMHLHISIITCMHILIEDQCTCIYSLCATNCLLCMLFIFISSAKGT